MGKQKITDEMKDKMKTLFTKGLLPCEEIADRMDISRQSVAVILKKAGVNTAKRKYIVECTNCKNLTEKTRMEVRKHEHNFCSNACYGEWLKRPEVQEERQRQQVARDAFAKNGLFWDAVDTRMFFTKKDTFVFENRESLLEWKRTGLPVIVWSVCKGKNIIITFSEANKEND